MFLSSEESSSSAFEIHPKGICRAVCVEVVTHNKKTNEPFTKIVDGEVKNRLILIFQTERKTVNEDGQEVHMVYWDWHNIPKSIANENSSLHKRLKEWGVPIQDFGTKADFERAVVGRPATLVFSHAHSDKTGKDYANISSCIEAEEGEPTFVATDYKRYAA